KGKWEIKKAARAPSGRKRPSALPPELDSPRGIPLSSASPGAVGPKGLGRGTFTRTLGSSAARCDSDHLALTQRSRTAERPITGASAPTYADRRLPVLQPRAPEGTFDRALREWLPVTAIPP